MFQAASAFEFEAEEIDMKTDSLRLSIEEARIRADFEKYRTLGGWVERPADMQPALEGDVHGDVIIVGAGYAGLHAALALRQQGLNVILLEREFAGYGASGRNAGYLAGGIGVEYGMFAKKIGLEQGRQVIRYYEEAVTFVERMLKELGIDCDYNQSGIVRAGLHPAHEKRVRNAMQLGAELGMQTVFLDREALRERGIPPAFLFGEYTSHGGSLHPGKYVMGLRHAVLRAGVRLYENTPLLSYEEGPEVAVITPNGRARAPVVVFATNAYTPQIGLLANQVVPFRVSAIETETLTASQLQSLGWHGREGIMTAHWIMESFRLTAHNTLLVTTTKIQFPYGSKTPNAPAYESYRALRSALHERLPMLKDVSIRACWSGYVSAAGDALPAVGITGEYQNIHYCAGCSGHGLAQQSMLGNMMAERILGKEPALLQALSRKVPLTLPEPLQWLGVKATLGLVGLLDAGVNRKIRDSGGR